MGDVGFGAGFAAASHRTAEESAYRASADPSGPGNSPYSASVTLLLCGVLPGVASAELLLSPQSPMEMPSQQPPGGIRFSSTWYMEHPFLSLTGAYICHYLVFYIFI